MVLTRFWHFNSTISLGFWTEFQILVDLWEGTGAKIGRVWRDRVPRSGILARRVKEFILESNFDIKNDVFVQFSSPGKKKGWKDNSNVGTVVKIFVDDNATFKSVSQCHWVLNLARIHVRDTRAHVGSMMRSKVICFNAEYRFLWRIIRSKYTLFSS